VDQPDRSVIDISYVSESYENNQSKLTAIENTLTRFSSGLNSPGL